MISAATDWDLYYASVPATARLTRRYTTRVLVDAIRKFGKPRMALVEIGGANSCFVESIVAAVSPGSYDVIDSNEYGLSLLAGRNTGGMTIGAHCQSVLGMSYARPADLVFSVGLVEHFEVADTRKAVLAHFDALDAGGVVLITFPAPTLLYRVARKAIEMAGMWKFPDERPLEPGEVLAAVRERGDVLFERILWPLVLTQYLVVARKR